MKIGILYPRSNAHPEMTTDYLDGLKTLLNLNHFNDRITLVFESIGFGGNEKEVYEKAERLLVIEDAAILVAYIDTRVLDILKPLAYATGKLLLIVHPGANYQPGTVPQPNILQLTLQQGFCCWLTGNLAGERKNSGGVLATSFYDCGYLHGAAIVKGFQRSGGLIKFNYINKQGHDESFNLAELTDYLEKDVDTDNLLCVFDTLPAGLFYERLRRLDLNRTLNLFVSPMMLEQGPLDQLSGSLPFRAQGCACWTSNLKTDANTQFRDAFTGQTKRQLSIFALLGWETGLILKTVVSQFASAQTGIGDIPAATDKLVIQSPRGELSLDPESNNFIGPVYQCSVAPDSGEESWQEVEGVRGKWSTFMEEPYEQVSSGWTNTYLCY